MIYVIAGLVILSLVFLVMFIFEHSRVKSLNTKNKQLEEHNAGLRKEIEKITAVNKIKEDNQNEAEQKINEVLTGDSVSNAINILRK